MQGLALAAHVPVFLLCVIAFVGVLRRFAPWPEDGDHPFPLSKAGITWSYTLQLNRVLFYPWWGPMIVGSAVLRSLAVRAMGGRMELGTMCSSDVTLVDPGLLYMEKGALLGSRCILTGHFAAGPTLFLGTTRILAGAQVNALARIGPRTIIGKNARIGIEATLLLDNHIGENTVVGYQIRMLRGARIGRDASIGNGVVLGKGVQVGDGATVKSWTNVPDGTVIPAGAVYPSVEPSNGRIAEDFDAPLPEDFLVATEPPAR